MPHAILTANSLYIGKVTTRLPINGVERNSGATIVGDTFALGAIDDYYLQLDLVCAGVGDQRKDFIIELFNETTGQVLQTLRGGAAPLSGGQFLSFLFSLSVVNATHFYSIRVTPLGSGSGTNMLTITSCRTLVTSFISSIPPIPPSAVVLVSRVLSIDLLVAGVYTFPMPPGGIPVFTDEIGVACTALVGAIATQAVIQAGITGNNSKKLGPETTTLLTAVNRREIYTLLKDDTAELSGTIEVVTPATGPTSYMAAAYAKIITEM